MSQVITNWMLTVRVNLNASHINAKIRNAYRDIWLTIKIAVITISVRQVIVRIINARIRKRLIKRAFRIISAYQRIALIMFVSLGKNKMARSVHQMRSVNHTFAIMKHAKLKPYLKTVFALIRRANARETCSA